MIDLDNEDDDDRMEREIAILKSHTVQLSEHFEASLILVTRYDPESGNTITVTKEFGNHHSIYSMAREWIDKHDEYTRINAREN